MTIAVHAGESQVVEVGFAAVLARDDVVHLEGHRITGRWQMAVFTAVASARREVWIQIGVHERGEGFSPRDTRAFDCIMASTFAMSQSIAVFHPVPCCAFCYSCRRRVKRPPVRSMPDDTENPPVSVPNP